jgi:hydrogenase small subunit
MEPGNAKSAPIAELDILWITAGLGCDGDTIAMTIATQPGIEDIVLGAMPWIPNVYLHNPFLSFDKGEEFMAHFHAAAEGRSSREFILVIEGSIPNDKNKEGIRCTSRMKANSSRWLPRNMLRLPSMR